ncbi:unnamed protein product [Closterium sp. NIES-54]
MVTTTTPGGQRVLICTCTRTGHHLATFTHRPGSSLYILATEPPQVAASAQVSASGQVAPPCSCRLLSHQTLMWHNQLGHPSLPRLRVMHSHLLVYGLPRSLRPLLPSRAPPCLPCVEGRQRAAPHSSSFPQTTAPLQTLHMDVWGPAHVSGRSRERYFLLVVDDYMRYTTFFFFRGKGEVLDVLIPWIRAARLQLRERFHQDLPVLHLHSDIGGDFSSDLLRDFCRGEGSLQTFTLPASPQQNGIAERRIGLVMDVARTSIIHAADPHFLWPFAVWGRCAFVRDTSADKLSAHAIPCVFLGFPPDAPGWQFFHPTSRRVLPSQDVTFDKQVPINRLFPYRPAPLPPPPLFLAPGPPLVDPLPPQGPAPSGAARGVASGGAEPGGAEPAGAELVGAESEGAEFGGAEPRCTLSPGGPPGALSRREPLSPPQLHECSARCTRLLSCAVRAGGSAAGGTGAPSPRGTGAVGAGSAEGDGAGDTRAGAAGGSGAAGPGGARTGGTGAVGTGGGAGVGAGNLGAGAAGGTGAAGPEGSRAGGTRAAGAGGAAGVGAGDTGARGADPGGAGAVGAGSRDTGRSRPYFVPLLQKPASPQPASLPALPPSPAPPYLPYVEGRQRAAPHFSSFPLTSTPLQTLPMDVWGPAHISGQGRERYFLLVVDDYARYTTVFPLRGKGEVPDVLIPWIRAVRLLFRQDLPLLRLHSNRGGEFSSDLLWNFCHGEGILQSFSLPASPQQNGIAERRIGLVMEVARTSMIHAAARHFLWTFAVQYAAHQLNLWPRVSLPETSPTLRWTRKAGDASEFRVWGSRAFVRDTTTDKLSARAIPCVFLGFPPDAPGWQFYHPTSRRVFPSQDVTFDELVPFYRLFPYRFAPPPPPPLFLAPGPLQVDPLAPQGLAPSGVSKEGAEPEGAEPGGAESEGAGSGGAEPGGAEPAGMEPSGAKPKGVELGGAESEGAKSAAAEAGDSAAGNTGAGGVGGVGVTAGVGGTKGVAAAGARTRGTKAAGSGSVGGTGAGGSGAGDPVESGGAGARGTCACGAVGGGAGAVDPGAGGARAGGAVSGGTGAGGTVRPRPNFVPLLQQVLGLPSSPVLTPPFLCPPPDQSQPSLQPASPLPAPSPYTEQTGGLIERREPVSCRASPVRADRIGRRFPRQRPPPVPGTHHLALRPSSIPQRVPLPSPPASSLADGPDPYSNLVRAASPTVPCLLATVVTDPSFESAVASTLVADLVDFAAACRLDYVASLVAESDFASPPSVGGECALGTDVLEDVQEDFECFAAAVPHLVSMLIAPEGDPNAPNIPTPLSYAEAITGPYSSQWRKAMDTEMASWKYTGTYVDAIPPSGANIVDGMWIFRVKRPSGSPPAFKACYIARGFNQRQGVDFFHTFSPTPKMTTLRVLLHVAAQRDYELHTLDFSTAFLQGSLHEQIWLRSPPGFTGSFSAGTQTTLAALDFAPSTADPSLFLLTDTSLPPFNVLVYVEDLVFATADTKALALVKSELQKRHTCTDLGELRSYLGLQITRDKARRTITRTQSYMVHQVLQRFGFRYSSPQSTPLPTCHSLSTPPSDESVEPSGQYLELMGCLVYLMTCTRPNLAYPLSILARYVMPGRHRPELWRPLRGYASWVDNLATQRSSQGYTFSLGSGSVSWRSTRSSSVLSSSCEAEIYAGAMAAHELRWLTYLLTDLGERPCSSPVLYVDNKAMISLCQKHRLEHITKHIALRYFLARELQHRGQLRLAYMAIRASTADIFTKALQSGGHRRFCTVLGLVPTLPHLLTA